MIRLNPQQLGVCSWSLQPKDVDDLASLISQTGVRKLQLALTGFGNNVDQAEAAYKALTNQHLTIVSGMLEPYGEDYSSLQTIRRTGGFVREETWPQNWRRVQDVAVIAKRLRLSMVSGHVGFIPEDPREPGYSAMLTRLRLIADHFRNFDLSLLFETGQETAMDLWRFLDDLNRPNVGINFDPGNMVLYGKGDPVDALKKLLPRVKQVHLKDAKAATKPGTWGTEVTVGTGQVNWPALFKVLASANFHGPLVFEREAGVQRLADIHQGVHYVTKLWGSAS